MCLVNVERGVFDAWIENTDGVRMTNVTIFENAGGYSFRAPFDGEYRLILYGDDAIGRINEIVFESQ